MKLKVVVVAVTVYSLISSSYYLCDLSGEEGMHQLLLQILACDAVRQNVIMVMTVWKMLPSQSLDLAFHETRRALTQ